MAKYYIELNGKEADENGHVRGELLGFQTLWDVEAENEAAAKRIGKERAAELYGERTDVKITQIEVHVQNW